MARREIMRRANRAEEDASAEGDLSKSEGGPCGDWLMVDAIDKNSLKEIKICEVYSSYQYYQYGTMNHHWLLVDRLDAVEHRTCSNE